ncbi:ankyrin repeat-containing domain protein [Aspergillus carlsbadensis]|nr:ankyrin repeat-containing domain protein [Aspergillus carlsbadensis]
MFLFQRLARHFRLAIQCGHASTFRLLLSDSKIDAHSTVAHTYLSPIYCALEVGSVEFVRALIEKGASIRIDGRIDRNVFRKAVRSRNIALIQYLVEQELVDEGTLAFCLSESVGMGQVEMVNYVLSLGVDLNHPEARGVTTLNEAIYNSHPDSERHLEIMQALIARGANVNSTILEKTPLEWALLCRDPRVVRVLLENGADPNRRDAHGRTPLHREASTRFVEKDPEIHVLRALLDHGGDPKIKDEENKSPLYAAIVNGNERAVELLLENGAAPNIPEGADNQAALFVAVPARRMMEILLQHGARLGPDAQGQTPLDWALEHRFVPEAAILLLERGVKLGSEMHTPLTAAARKGLATVVRFLLDNNWDPSLPDKVAQDTFSPCNHGPPLPSCPGTALKRRG